MKLKDLFTPNKNSNNQQVVCTLKKKQLKKYGLTPEELMDLRIPKTKRRIRYK